MPFSVFSIVNTLLKYFKNSEAFSESLWVYESAEFLSSSFFGSGIPGRVFNFLWEYPQNFFGLFFSSLAISISTSFFAFLVSRLIWFLSFYPRPVLAFEYCHRLRLWVCVCVCINHELVRTIPHRPFKLGSPNLDQRCKTPWFGSLLFLGMIDLDLQGQI